MNSDPNNTTDAYYEALMACVDRYALLAELLKDSDLIAFVQVFKNGCTNRLPLMKLNRWLGFIQGVLIANNMTTVEIERNWSRPLFGPLDFPTFEETPL